MHQRLRRTTILFLTAIALALGGVGCGDDAEGTGTTGPAAGSTTAAEAVPEAAGGERVGAEGGVVRLDFGDEGTSADEDASGAGTGERPPQVELEIPAGALDEEVDITIAAYPATPESAARPEGYRVASRIFEFGPEGLTFNEPVTVRMRYSGSADGLSVYWTEPGSRSVYGEVDAAILDRGVASAQVTHFSRGFVGATCTPECDGLECGPDGCGGLCGTCASGERCSAGVCEEVASAMPTPSTSAGGSTECLSNADCRPGEACISGFCEVQPPATDSSAGPPTTTTPSATPVGSFVCEADGDCPSEQACVGGVCQSRGTGAGCTVDADCASGEVCIENACEAAGSGNPAGSSAACSSDADCGSGNTCSGGVCVPVGSGEPTCSDNSDCAAGEICLGVCVPEPAGSAACSSDADCAAGEICSGGVCTAEASCATPNDCGGCTVLEGAVGDTCGPCGNGTLLCDGTDALACSGGVDLENDINNCGSCGTACTPGFVCDAGVCVGG